MWRQPVKKVIEAAVEFLGDPDDGPCQKKPQDGIKQADLSQKMDSIAAVIPDIPLGPKIDATAGDEFDSRNDCRPDGATYPEGCFFFELFIGPVDQSEAAAPGQEHRPVAVAPP